MFNVKNLFVRNAVSNRIHQLESACGCQCPTLIQVTDLQLSLSSETKADEVPWLVETSPTLTPSPGANGQGGGQWSVCLSSVLDKQYHFCVSCDLERAQQLWPRRSVAQHAMELSGARV